MANHEIAFLFLEIYFLQANYYYFNFKNLKSIKYLEENYNDVLFISFVFGSIKVPGEASLLIRFSFLFIRAKNLHQSKIPIKFNLVIF